MPHDTASGSPPLDPIVAVFDTKTMALRAIAELSAAQFTDYWLGVVSGENDAGETTVAADGEAEIVLHDVLAQRGSIELDVHRFDGILPPGTAVMSLRVRAKLDDALEIIELIGGHVDHV
jgi:hypothetical protein